MIDFPKVTRLYSDCIGTVFSEGNGYNPYDRFPKVTRLYLDCILTVSSEEKGYDSYDQFLRRDTAIIIPWRAVGFISLAPLWEEARDKIILFQKGLCRVAMILILSRSK
jgi:hypothetical protein